MLYLAMGTNVRIVHLRWSQSAGHRSLDEAVQDHIDELADLADVAPDLSLDGRIHLHLLYGERDQLIQDVSDLKYSVWP